jgi:hypothetical protein
MKQIFGICLMLLLSTGTELAKAEEGDFSGLLMDVAEKAEGCKLTRERGFCSLGKRADGSDIVGALYSDCNGNLVCRPFSK